MTMSMTTHDVQNWLRRVTRLRRANNLYYANILMARLLNRLAHQRELPESVNIVAAYGDNGQPLLAISCPGVTSQAMGFERFTEAFKTLLADRWLKEEPLPADGELDLDQGNILWQYPTRLLIHDERVSVPTFESDPDDVYFLSIIRGGSGEGVLSN